MNIEINSSYKFATLLDSKIKMQNVHVSTVEIKHMQLGNCYLKTQRRGLIRGDQQEKALMMAEFAGLNLFKLNKWDQPH